jgi:glycosyltransferase involved in cell wall biosynthesis
VVPNGAEPHGEPVDHVRAPGDGAVFVFVGLLSYPPNRDAVRWFATEVWASVRAELPTATFRVVGRGADGLQDVAAIPGVDLVGPVPEVGPELDRADVVVVPIRMGAGTRLKVVEAIANGVPCVSTSVGAEGIAVEDGTHVLLADSATRFAADCVRVASDTTLRAALVEAGRRLWADRYRWAAIRERFADLVEDVSRG